MTSIDRIDLFADADGWFGATRQMNRHGRLIEIIRNTELGDLVDALMLSIEEAPETDCPVPDMGRRLQRPLSGAWIEWDRAAGWQLHLVGGTVERVSVGPFPTLPHAIAAILMRHEDEGDTK